MAKSKPQNKGITLILTLSILSAILALVLGIATLLTREMKLAQEIANSILAYSAADTGIERLMYGVNKEALDITTCQCGTTNCYSGTLSNNASYVVCIKQIGPPVKVKSTGTYRGTNRTIEASY